jgi:hypothetical protein
VVQPTRPTRALRSDIPKSEKIVITEPRAPWNPNIIFVGRFNAAGSFGDATAAHTTTPSTTVAATTADIVNSAAAVDSVGWQRGSLRNLLLRW